MSAIDKQINQDCRTFRVIGFANRYKYKNKTEWEEINPGAAEAVRMFSDNLMTMGFIITKAFEIDESGYANFGCDFSKKS